MPRCKSCNNKFEQYQFLNKFCKGLDCQTAKAMFLLDKKKQQNKKDWSKEKKERKEALKTREDYYQETLKVFNEYIRKRDFNKPCISCDAPPLTYRISSGHFHPQGTYRNIALNEDNSHGQCWFNCNKNRHGNLSEYRPRLIKRIGQERVDNIDMLRNGTLKLSIPELIILKEDYKKKIKSLKPL